MTLASLIDREDGISIEALLKDSYSELRPQFDRLLTRLNEDYVTGVDREILLQDPQPTLQFLQPVQLQSEQRNKDHFPDNRLTNSSLKHLPTWN